MKKLFNIILFVICVTQFISCTEWLDIKPKTQVEQDELFASERGFEDAIAGVYLNLKGIYTNNLTMGTIEYLAQHWTVIPNTTGESLSYYDHESAQSKTVFSRIYLKLYNTIAHTNNILKYIDESKEVFYNEDKYELIKGEALALRAYLHFDLLRLFGPIPTEYDNGLVLPYVTELSKDNPKYSTYEQYVSKIEQDLDNAELLLKDSDPLCKYSAEKLNNPSIGDDVFLSFRKVRMNYYSVLGLKARFYLWTQNKPDAYKYAKMVIDAKNPDGGKKFRLGNMDDVKQNDKTFISEHLFSLSIYNLPDLAQTLYIGEKARYYKDKDRIIEDVYEDNTTDIRRKDEMWEEIAGAGNQTNFVIKKYFVEDNAAEYKKVVPLIRLYEMYLIAIECSPLSESNSYFEEILTSRIVPLLVLTSEAHMIEEVVKEYRKEFYAEGVMFYTYKRLFYKDILWYNYEVNKDIYQIPLPQTELKQ